MKKNILISGLIFFGFVCFCLGYICNSFNNRLFFEKSYFFDKETSKVFFKGPDGNYSTTNKDIGVYPDYLSIVACFKNEAPYLKEWIEYHHMLGVDRFYLYNNESDDNFMEVLRPYINSGLVVYTNWPGKAQQIPIYADAIKKIKDKTRWVATIDIDEFILPMKENSIPKVIKNYEDYGALAVFWRGFDSNGHVQKPDGLVIENYTRTYQGNMGPSANGNNLVGGQLKLIFNPRLFERGAVHIHQLYNNTTAIDENGDTVGRGGGFNEGYNTQTYIRINHYSSKSLEEYNLKVNKGDAASGISIRPLEKERYHYPRTQQDTTILRFLPELKRRMR